MTTTRLLAQMTVTESTAAEAWYTRLLGHEPDATPMPGLLEWHLADSFGVHRIVFTGPLGAGAR